jgi:hypothetical protein
VNLEADEAEQERELLQDQANTLALSALSHENGSNSRPKVGGCQYA